MKKLFIVLITVLFFAGVKAGASELLKVGDPMPDVSGIKIQHTRHWVYQKRAGVRNIRFERSVVDGDLAVDAYLICNGKAMSISFGI